MEKNDNKDNIQEDDEVACVKLDDLETYLTTAGPGEIRKQFEAIPTEVFYPCEAGRIPANSRKNRYDDLLPYDKNRVILRRVEDDPNSDYINASYVDGYMSKRQFIVTQGPLDNTVEDFWRLVWQEGVQVIIMVANIIENDTKKCEKYWPDKKRKYGKILITLTSERIFLDYTIRNFIIQKSGAGRKLKQFHFTAWPDHGIPSSPSSLNFMLQKAMDARPPYLIHCSAGVGRTGTLVLLVHALESWKTQGHADLPRMLISLRHQRVNLVETSDQYQFVYDALVASHPQRDTWRRCSELILYLNVLRKKDSITGNTGLDQQFSTLQKLCRPMSKEDCHTALRNDNQDKNRSANILPLEINLVRFNPPLEYVNAVYVAGYGTPDRYIVTQYPLPHTIPDFWRVVLRSQACHMVLLNHLSHHDKQAPQFWADAGCQYYGDVRVESVSTKNVAPGLLARKLKVKDLASQKSKTRVIRQLHYHDWHKGDIAPPSVSTLLVLVKKAVRRMTSKYPLVVLCYDGCSASGFFCASGNLWCQAREEGGLDVSQAVRTVRASRPNFIVNKDQYRWLYEVASQLATELANPKK